MLGQGDIVTLVPTTAMGMAPSGDGGKHFTPYSYC